MKRFTHNFIFNFTTLKLSNRNFNFIRKPSKSSTLLNNISYRFSKQNLSSREIDIKIGQQKWKNLQNNYKALKTSFGLKMPLQVSKDYPTPDIIQFTLEALRYCSNQYPEYLLEQLKKQDSNFYQVIDNSLNDLWKADKKQALQMISFIIHWKIHLKNEEIGEVLVRTVKKMDLNLFEIFQLLKIILTEGQGNLERQTQQVQSPSRQKQSVDKNLGINIVQGLDIVFKRLLAICENKIISRLQVIQPQQYEALFKIINILRHFDVYPSTKESGKEQEIESQITFFDIIQTNLLKNLTEIPPSSLVTMAVHYANNTKQNQDERIQILQKLQERIIFNMKFFNHEEMIAILYSYMRTSMMSKEFTEKFVRRIRLIYHELSWENKRKILSLSSNFPQHEKILIISEAHNELIRGKPVITKQQDGSTKKQFDPIVYIDPDYQLVPQIYLASYQNNLLTEQLTKKMQDIILQNIYNYNREQVVRAVWLFTATPGANNNLERLHKKLQVIIEGGFQGGEYTVKDVSIIVWSLCNSGTSNQEIYKPEAQFWNNIEFYLQEKLLKQEKLSKQEKLLKQEKTSQISPLNNSSSILWAYTFNRPLKFKTVSLITDILLEEMIPNKEEINLHSFQLINILTFYYSLPKKAFPSSLVLRIRQLCVQYFQLMYLEMNSLELMKCLKYLAADEVEGGQLKLVIKIKVWENIVETFMLQADSVQYEHIMGIVGLVVNSPLGRSRDKKVMQLVAKLLKRKKSLQQIKSVQNDTNKAK